MNSIKSFFKPHYHKLVRMAKWWRRIGLKSKDFTIISNNCTGGYVYQYYGISYKTPTEGLYFITSDYLKLVERPEYYFTHDVVLIEPQESVLAKRGLTIDYPVGLIDDIEVYFMHYHDPKEAIDKWKRRSSRMNLNKVFYLLTETELMQEGDVRRFSELIVTKKLSGVCLTLRDYHLPYTQFVPDVPEDEDNSNAAWYPELIIKCIDWKTTLNNL